jgi:hypothetical protein
MKIVNLSPEIAPEDSLVRLVCPQGADELNVDGRSFRPDHRRAFHVPRRYVRQAELTVGGFVEQPLSKTEALQDVAGPIASLPPGREHDVLSAALSELAPDAE